MSAASLSRFQALQTAVQRFNEERDWAQYHGVKNLTMALASEVGELLALLRWVPSEGAERGRLDAELLARIEDELGDITLVLLTLALRLDMDLLELGDKKLRRNAEKYPVEASRGRAEPSHE